MKNKLLVLVSLILVLGIAIIGMSACDKGANPSGGENEATKKPNTNDSEDSEDSILNGSLEDIIKAIYDNAEIDDENMKEYLKTGVETVEINSENVKYHLGKEDIEFKEAVASEPLIQPSAYSLCLVRVKEGQDIEKVKEEIRDNVDPTKWVCVGVDEKNIIVDSREDVIFLVMSDDIADELHESFLNLK